VAEPSNVEPAREVLIARHSQWVALYNANLDRRVDLQKSDKQLQRELEAWEDSHSRSISMKSKDRPVENSADWERRHDADYKKLIEQARRSKALPLASDSGVNRLPITESPLKLKPIEEQANVEIILVDGSEEE